MTSLVLSWAATAWAGPGLHVVRAQADDTAMAAVPCPQGACVASTLGPDTCSAFDGPVHTLVLTGHSRPPEFFGVEPTAIARLVACAEPELLVLDTCYGFSTELLTELAALDAPPLVVGSIHALSVEGLRYDPDFLTDPGLSAAERARHVHPRYGEVLQTWAPEAASLASAREVVASWTVDELEARLQRVHPNLVRVPLPESEIVVLHEMAPARFTRPGDPGRW